MLPNYLINEMLLKVNGEGAEIGELMRSKVNKKAAEDKKAAEEAVQKRLDDMKNKAANDEDIAVKDQGSKDSKVSKPLEIVEPNSGSAVVAPKKKKKKVAKAKEQVAEVPKVQNPPKEKDTQMVQDPPKVQDIPKVQDLPKENSEVKPSIVDKVIMVARWL